jgi:protein SCO1/2
MIYVIIAMNKSSLSIVVSVALALGFLVSFFPGSSMSAQVVANNSSPIQLEVITLLGDKARVLPEFELIDHNKQILGKTRLRGKWSLMLFGYTSCPDICPTTLNTINYIVNAIDDPDVREAVRVYFVSVDPQRDKPDLLATYMNYFNPDFTGATADTEKLKILTSALGVSHKIKKKSEDDLSYAVSHSGFIVLIDPEVQFTGLFFSAPDDVQAIARDMTRLVKHTDN